MQSNYAEHMQAQGRIEIMEATARRLERQVPDEAGKIPSEFTPDLTREAEVATQVQAMYAQASATNNQGMMQYLVNFISGNTAVQGALLQAGTSVGLSFEGLAAILAEKSKDFADKLLGAAGKGGATPTAPKISMGGGNTFNIKQDFRDQDPDRIAIVFQRDIMRAALTPRQSRFNVMG
jgi:hypothetical protein